MNPDNILAAFALTLFAGLATGIGSALAFFTDRTNTRFLAGSLGFSAGVMLYVSFVELLGGARTALSLALGSAHAGELTATGAFFAGIALIAIIDRFVPEAENPHEAHTVEEMCDGSPCWEHPLIRTGIITALVIGVHNFPEGLATFVSSMEDTSLGFSIAAAVAIHNIPEGIAVSVPVYYATGSRKKAFLWSFLSGLTEPLGALAGYVLLMQFISPVVSQCILAGVAGIMVYISMDELLPSAQKYGEHHLSIYGAITGMAVMAVSLMAI